MHSSHMGPHPLPGGTLDGKPSPVNVEKNPSILLLFVPRGPGAVVRGRGGGILLGAAAEEAVWAGAFGPAMPAQLGRGGAGPAWGVGSRHWSQEEEKLGQAILLRLQGLLLVCHCRTVHVDLKGQTWAGEKKQNLHPYQNTFWVLKSGLQCSKSMVSQKHTKVLKHVYITATILFKHKVLPAEEVHPKKIWAFSILEEERWCYRRVWSLDNTTTNPYREAEALSVWHHTIMIDFFHRNPINANSIYMPAKSIYCAEKYFFSKMTHRTNCD